MTWLRGSASLGSFSHSPATLGLDSLKEVVVATAKETRSKLDSIVTINVVQGV